MAAGLVKGEGFAVDASIIEAEAGSKLAMPGDEPHVWQNPAHCKRAVREYLEGLDAETTVATAPKRISLADPQSSWTAAPSGPAFFAYSTNYLIDVAHGVIVDVEATPAHRTSEVPVGELPLLAGKSLMEFRLQTWGKQSMPSPTPTRQRSTGCCSTRQRKR